MAHDKPIPTPAPAAPTSSMRVAAATIVASVASLEIKRELVTGPCNKFLPCSPRWTTHCGPLRSRSPHGSSQGLTAFHSEPGGGALMQLAVVWQAELGRSVSLMLFLFFLAPCTMWEIDAKRKALLGR
jgi:hypothetical protein